MNDLVESWACLAAWLEYEQGLDRPRAEVQAISTIDELRKLVTRTASLSEVHAALLEAESGRPKRLEGMV